MRNAAGSTVLASILAGGVWTLGLRITFVLLAFGAAAVLARAVAAPELGSYFLVVSISAFLGLAFSAGLPGVAVREIGRWRSLGEAHRAESVGASVLLLSVRLAIIALALGALLALTALAGWLPVHPATVALSALIAAGSALQVVVAEIFRGYGRIAEAAMFGGTLAAGLNLILLVVSFILFPRINLHIALAVFLTAIATSVAVGVRRLPRTSQASDAPAAKRLLVQGRSFWATSLATFVLYQSDLWVAGLVLPLQQVALYGAAARLVQPLAFPIEATEAALAPSIVSLHARGALEELAAVLARCAQVQLGLVAAGALFLIITGRELLTGIFGPDYAPAYGVLVLLASGWCVRAATGAFGYLLLLTQHADRIATLTVAWALASLLAGWLAGGVWGLSGVAAASAVMLSTFCILGAVVSFRLTGVPSSALGALQSRRS